MVDSTVDPWVERGMDVMVGWVVSYAKNIVKICNKRDWSHLPTPDLVTCYVDGVEDITEEESDPVEIISREKIRVKNRINEYVGFSRFGEEEFGTNSSDEDFSSTEDNTRGSNKEVKRRKTKRKLKSRNNMEQLIFKLEM